MNQTDPRHGTTPNPKKQFASPEILMADKKLPMSEKRKLLEQWKQDLTLEHTATQENMPVQSAPGRPAPSTGEAADMLQRVSDCLRKASEGESDPTPRKPAAPRRH